MCADCGRRGRADRAGGNRRLPRTGRRRLSFVRIPSRGGRARSGGIRTVLYQPLRPPRQPLPLLRSALHGAARPAARGCGGGDADGGGPGRPGKGRGAGRRCRRALRRPVAARGARTPGDRRTHVCGLSRGILDGGRPRMPGGEPFDARAALHPEHGRLQRAAKGARSPDPHGPYGERPRPELSGQRGAGQRYGQGGARGGGQRQAGLAASRAASFGALYGRSPAGRRSAAVHVGPLHADLHRAGHRPSRVGVLRYFHARRALCASGRV